MSEPQAPGPAEVAAHDVQSALFAQLVMQQTNLAMMMLGMMPNPEGGETIKDLGAAEMFINTLEMLEAKTKGNLTRQEAGLLQQSLMGLRMAFVEAVNGAPQGGPAPAPSAAAAPTTPPTAPSTDEEEGRKKFSKKY